MSRRTVVRGHSLVSDFDCGRAARGDHAHFSCRDLRAHLERSAEQGIVSADLVLSVKGGDELCRTPLEGEWRRGGGGDDAAAPCGVRCSTVLCTALYQHAPCSVSTAAGVTLHGNMYLALSLQASAIGSSCQRVSTPPPGACALPSSCSRPAAQTHCCRRRRPWQRARKQSPKPESQR